MATTGSTISGFTQILKGVWTFLNSKLFVIILIVLLIMFAAGECRRIMSLKTEIDTHDQNISALKDSLKFERTKNGALLVSIDGYISTEKELKSLNKGLWDEVTAQKGKVISLTNLVVILKQDSAQLAKTVDKLNTIIGTMLKIDDSTFVAPWTLAFTYDSTNYDVFRGRTQVGISSKDPLILRHKNTYLLERKTQIELTWGEKVEKGKLRIFVKSNYPGFTVKSMEGVLIDPNNNPLFKDLMKKRHWFTGFGIGPELSTGWNILQAKPAIVVGVGIHYNIYEF
jgi:hypothetical protein